LLLFFFAATILLPKTSEADKSLGVWLSEHKTGKIDVYEPDDKYFGKVIWGKTMYEPNATTSRKDVKNKDEKLRASNFKDMAMLYDLTYRYRTY